MQYKQEKHSLTYIASSEVLVSETKPNKLFLQGIPKPLTGPV